jgi:hypothetical protein
MTSDSWPYRDLNRQSVWCSAIHCSSAAAPLPMRCVVECRLEVIGGGVRPL